MDAELLKPEHYRNRELSWIQFNYRVLEEARDKTLPLFERLKFLSITASNLDEFFMVRVASLKDMVHAKYKKPDIAGLKPEEQLEKISKELHEFVELQYSTYNRSLLPLLEQEDVTIITSHKKLNKEQKKFVDDYFMKNVYPVLTPMAVDSSRPFPLIRNKTLNIASLIRKKGDADAELDFATVQVPSVLPRIVKVPSENGITIILLEQIIERNIHKLYLNYDVVCAHPYRIERNADLSIDEEEAADLLKEIQKQLKKRQWGEVIKLEVDDKINKDLLRILKKELNTKEDDIYYIGGPLDLTFLMKVYGLDGYDHLKTPKYIPKKVPQINPELSIFERPGRWSILRHTIRR